MTIVFFKGKAFKPADTFYSIAKWTLTSLSVPETLRKLTQSKESRENQRWPDIAEMALQFFKICLDYSG